MYITRKAMTIKDYVHTSKDAVYSKDKEVFMKRNMDLIRKLLFALEDREEDLAESLTIDGYTNEMVAYHCSLLYDAGYVKCYDGLYGDDHLIDYGVGSLTWDGAEFLEKVRSNKVWNKTKEVIVHKGLPMALDVIKSVVESIVFGIVSGALKQP